MQGADGGKGLLFALFYFVNFLLYLQKKYVIR